MQYKKNVLLLRLHCVVNVRSTDIDIVMLRRIH